jgi:chemotaxis protein methyltransferase CheR
MNLTHIRFEGSAAMPAPRNDARALVLAAGSRQRSEVVRPPEPIGGLAGWVLSRCGLNPDVYRIDPLRRRLAACLRGLKVESETSAIECLKARPELLRMTLNTLLIGVSEFFRDAQVFETLRTSVIPALRDRPGSLRVWSLGCSNGAELCSVAIELAEAGMLDRAWLLGTDCRADAIARAAMGVFAEGELAGMDARLRARYFERTQAGWRAAGALRRQMHWELADGTRACPAGPWDIVLCRNVVIYLESGVAERMIARVASQLAPRGYLVVGKAERPPVSLKLGLVGRCVYRHGA